MNVHVWIAVFLIGVASNLDNAGVGIAYGVRRISISWTSNLTIAAVSFVATLASGIFGQVTSKLLNPHLASLIGTLVLIAVGLWVLLQPFLNKVAAEKETRLNQSLNPGLVSILRNPETADSDLSKSISFSEALVLGAALAMNALAGGFDAGVIGIDIWMTSLSVGVLSYLLLGLAAFIGKKYVADRLGDWATMIAGILLIFVGLHQMF